MSINRTAQRRVIVLSTILGISFLLTGCSTSTNTGPVSATLTAEEAANLTIENVKTQEVNILQFVIPIVLILGLITLIVVNVMKKRGNLAEEQKAAADGASPIDKGKKKKYEAPRPELEIQSELASKLKQGTEQALEGEWALQIIQQGMQQGTLSKTLAGPETQEKKRSIFSKRKDT